MPILIVLFCIPLLSALLTCCASFLHSHAFKRLFVVLSLIPLCLLLFLPIEWIGQHVKYAWMPFINVNFSLEVDSLSYIFLLLVNIVIPFSLIAIVSQNSTHDQTLYFLVFLLQALLIGFFTAKDLALFAFFWESMLIPLYFIIHLYGRERAHQVALKFLIYMIAGGTLLVSAILALYFGSTQLEGGATFDLDQLAFISQKIPYAEAVFLIFIVAFAVKTPLFPFHGWLPDTYTHSSVSGTLLLSGILSKAGIYGILRIAIPLFPDLLLQWSPLLMGLALMGVLYGGLAAWRQTDYKRLIAYSSFSHVNFILAGLFIWNQTAHSGAILQAFNHGIVITALFLIIYWISIRLETTTLGVYQGLATYLPKLCWFTLFFVAASIALPGTNSFIGELLILIGVFEQNSVAAAFLALSVILSAIYMLRMMQKLFFNEPSGFHAAWKDLYPSEIATLIPLIFLILWIGIYPTPLLKHINDAVKKIESTQLQEQL